MYKYKAMRIFKRVYHTLVQKPKITISKVPDIVSLPLVKYLPTFDYIYNEQLLAYG